MVEPDHIPKECCWLAGNCLVNNAGVYKTDDFSPDSGRVPTAHGVGFRLGRVMPSVRLLKIRFIKSPVVRLLLQSGVVPFQLDVAAGIFGRSEDQHGVQERRIRR